MYTRRILHHGADPTATPVEISTRAVAGCWFELHRQGGCGAGELVIRDRFPERNAIEVGDWISLEYETDDRWYLGRVEARRAGSPAGVQFQLEGMGIELNEVFPGGFAEDADGVPPHRYGQTDLFSNDPDYAVETFDTASGPTDVVTWLLTQFVTPATPIQYDPVLIESPPSPATVASIKFRGEESVRSIVKELAMVARSASWGVNEQGDFFFLQQNGGVQATYREGLNVTSLEESRDREFLFNRILLTGDYVYDVLDSSAFIARRSYRFRGNYIQPDSRDLYGERRIRLWIPWIRTDEDALAFVREFFRVYSEPTSRFVIETTGQTSLLKPWEGPVRLLDRDGNLLVTAQLDTLRVEFDQAPRFRMELGPADPHTLWPEPPQDERWELPQGKVAGGIVSLTEESSLSSLTSLSSLSSLGSTGSSGLESSGSSGSSMPGSSSPGSSSQGSSIPVSSSLGSSSFGSSSVGSSSLGSSSAGSSSPGSSSPASSLPGSSSIASSGFGSSSPGGSGAGSSGGSSAAGSSSGGAPSSSIGSLQATSGSSGVPPGSGSGAESISSPQPFSSSGAVSSDPGSSGS